MDDVSYHEADADGKSYDRYGVDRQRGCVVIARPDQYVGYVGELEDIPDLENYFETIFLARGERGMVPNH